MKLKINRFMATANVYLKHATTDYDSSKSVSGPLTIHVKPETGYELNKISFLCYEVRYQLTKTGDNGYNIYFENITSNITLWVTAFVHNELIDNDTKTAIMKEDYVSDIYVSVPYYALTINSDNYLVSSKLLDTKNVPDEGIFGSFVAKQIELKLSNLPLNVQLENKLIQVGETIKYKNSSNQMINKSSAIGTFVVTKVEKEDTTGITTVTALDDAKLFNS